MSEHIIETEVFDGTPFVPISGTRKLREEIVRCRDCKYASYDNRWCYRLLNAKEPPITPDGFCAWGGEEMSEYTDREIGPLTKAALENYLHPKPIGQRMDELERRISDVNDAALYDRSQLEERIDALERRIEQLEGHDLDTAIRVSNMERKLNHKGGSE